MRPIALLGPMIVASVSAAPCAEVPRHTRVYDLRFLFEDPAVATLPVPELDWHLPTLSGFPDLAPGTVPLDIPEIEGFEAGSVIQRFIDPDSWSNARNRLELDGRHLQVTQTREVLDSIDRFLAGLEARASRTFAVDLALVPTAAVLRTSPGCDRPASSPWLAADVLDRAVTADPARAVVLSSAASSGSLVSLHPASLSSLLTDYDVNRTGIIPVQDAVVTTALAGGHAQAVVYVTPRAGWVRLDVRAGRMGLAAKPERRQVAHGDLDLPVKDRDELRVSVVLPEGRTALLGICSPASGEAAQASRGFALLARVRRLEIEGGGEAGLAGVRMLEAAALLAPLPENRALSPAEASRKEGGDGKPQDDTPRALDPELFEQLLRSSLGKRGDDDEAPVAVAGGLVLAAGDALVLERVEQWIGDLTRERLRLVSVDLWQGQASAGEIGDAAAPGALLDAGWSETIATRPGLRARWISLGGAGAFQASVLERSYVAGLRLVSGGTAFKGVTVPDPEVSAVSSGLMLAGRCDLVSGAPWAELRIDARLAGPAVFGRTGRGRTSTALSPGEPTAGEAPGAEGKWVTFDLPAVSTETWQHLVTVPLGKPILLNALPDPASPGKTRALVAVVHEVPWP